MAIQINAAAATRAAFTEPFISELEPSTSQLFEFPEGIFVTSSGHVLTSVKNGGERVVTFTSLLVPISCDR